MDCAREEQWRYTIQVARLGDFDDVLRIDDDATALYAEAGVDLALDASHPFLQAEQARWRRATELGRVFFAVNGEASRVGFAALDVLDGAAYLDQLSVRRSAMRRGAGVPVAPRDRVGGERWTHGVVADDLRAPSVERAVL